MINFLTRAILICTVIAGTFAVAEPTMAQDAATVVSVEGQAWRITAQSSERRELVTGQSIRPGDLVVTGSSSQVALLLSDESMIRLHQSSEFRLNAAAASAGWLSSAKGLLESSYELLKGELWFRNKRREANIEITNRHVNISVRGTEFSVVVQSTVAYVSMLEGRINAFNQFGSINASSGEQVIAEQGKAPQKRLLLNPQDAVQWTIRLPELFSVEGLFDNSNSNSNKSVSQAEAVADDTATVYERALLKAKAAEFPAALNIIAESDQPSLELSLLGAWSQLETGQLREAQTALAELTNEHRTSMRGWLLYALASLMANDNDTALMACDRAQVLDPKSSSALLLKSYILQAQFQLEAATQAAKYSVQADPRLLAGWLQMARLAAAKEDYQSAKNHAETALALDNQNADALATLGFIELATGKRNKADKLFAAALDNHTALADAHLGLALSAMRSGDSESALKSIATAVAIEPAEANYMNYYGKILYQSGRIDRAVEVLERATELDPNDPTPLYLLAIIKRDLNRDGESIKLLQQAQLLNDKRAVYRSQQLLDSDRASKNVDLTLAFESFNFDGWAERRAVNAIELNPQSYSAHLMYANTLNNQPGRDTAFASAAMVARILQPATANTFNSPNDYTTLFEMPELGGTLSTSSGSFNDKRHELIFYGAHPDTGLAFQLDIGNAKSDGWRGTEDEEIDNTTAIFKWDPTYNSGFTLSLNHQTIEQSDRLDGRFEADAASDPRHMRDFELENGELAYRYHFSPNSLLMGQIGYLEQSIKSAEVDTINIDTIFGPVSYDTGVNSRIDEKFWQAQLQYLYSNEQHSATLGTVNYFGDIEKVTANYTRLIAEPFPGIAILPPVESLDANDTARTQYHSLYGLYQWHASDYLSIDIGAYLDYYQISEALFDQDWDEFDINPRFGLVYKITDHTSIRMAGYRYIFTLLPGRIDPIEVAGLTIYRGNQPGTEVTEANLAIEHEWSSGFFQVTGIYGEDKTEARQPFTDTIIIGLTSFPVTRGVETFTSAYRYGGDLAFNQLLFKQLGMSFNYQRLHFDSRLIRPEDNKLVESTLNRRDEIAELTFSSVFGSGLSFELGQIYRHIRYDSDRRDDEFSFTNAKLSWELPGKPATVSVTANNIFDKSFNWVVDSFVIDGRIPLRQTLLTLEVNL